MSDWKPNIFEYLDYREYLRDFYEAGKENVTGFRFATCRARPDFRRPIISN